MCPAPKKSIPPPPPEMIRLYLEASQDCISLINPEGNFYYCNPAFQKLFGYNASELIGLHFSKLPFFHSDKSELLQKVISDLKSGIKNSDTIQTSGNHKNGKKIWIETSITPLIQEGKLYTIQTVSREITDRILREKQISDNNLNIGNLLEGIPDPLLLHGLGPDNQPGDIVLCNQKAMELTGYSRKEILKMSIKDLDENLIRI